MTNNVTRSQKHSWDVTFIVDTIIYLMDEFCCISVNVTVMSD